MSNKMPEQKPAASDRLLDLLLDALVEREAQRQAKVAKPKAQARPPAEPPSDRRAPQARKPAAPMKKRRDQKQRGPGPGDVGWQPPPKAPSVHLEKVLVRFLVLVAVLVVAVNVPVNRYGVSLARILPDSASLVVRDGLVLKGSSPEIYMLQNDRLRWISSMDAFDHLRLKWGDVHVVDDAFLQRFEQGPPIHVLLKCNDSPHIYRLENQEKRWIRDIGTFLDEGHVWDDVKFVSCEYLRNIPDGLPIPVDAGPPPQP
jgi:hypothetical protein